MWIKAKCKWQWFLWSKIILTSLRAVSQIFIYNLQVWNRPKNFSRKSQWYLEKIPWMVSEDELFWEKIPWTKSKVSTISWKNSMNGVGRRAIWKNSMDQIEVKHTLVCFDRNVAWNFVKTILHHWYMCFLVSYNFIYFHVKNHLQIKD